MPESLSIADTAILRAVEQHPDGEVFRHVFEAMRHMRGAEQQVAGADIAHPVLDPVPARPRGNKIELVARMRNLRAIRRAGGDLPTTLIVRADEEIDVKRRDFITLLVGSAAWPLARALPEI